MFSGLLIQKYEIYKFGVGIGNKIAIKYAQNRFILQAFIKIAMISLLENLL